MRTIRFFTGVFLFTLTALFGSSQATVFTATNGADPGFESLREIIIVANENPGMDTIYFNIPGPGPHYIDLISALPVIDDPVLIDGYTQDGASHNTNAVGQGLNTVLKIVLNGNWAGGAVGLEISAGNSIVRGLAVINFESDGIWLHTNGGNRVEGVFTGTDWSGTEATGNLEGISIWSNNNTIGGTAPEWRNLISGNHQDGLFINAGAEGNVIQGNLIGTDINGTTGLGNTYAGIALWGANDNTIGGTDHGSHNVISGNGVIGILILDVTGTTNTVQGNFIGTDVTGTTRVENGFAGVVIQQEASGNVIGGIEPSARNIISGNGNGIYIAHTGTTGNIVQGNFIGVNGFGTEALMNSDIGVRIEEGASDNMIGGPDEGAGNTIAFNLNGGVQVSAGTDNSIFSNSIFDNGGLGINLGTDTVTPNDTLDGDTGANKLQNFPVLLEATNSFVLGYLVSTPSTPFTIQLFASDECDPSGHGEGKDFLGSFEGMTNNFGVLNFNFTFSQQVPTGQYITATATDPDGNTSEFSSCVPAGEFCVIAINSPMGGETWNAGDVHEITWMSDGEGRSGTLVIEYSTDGGYTWGLVTGETEDDGSYEWTIPGTPSHDCLVIVCDSGDTTCCGASEDVFTIHADCDFAMTHIAVSNPVSVDYPTPILAAITNLSILDIAPGNAYIDILDEGGGSIFMGDPVMMERLYTDLFFLAPSGDTLPYTYQYDWVPTETGNFTVKVMLAFPCDTFSVNDMMDISPVTVSEEGTGFLGYFNQYSTEIDTVPPEPDAGPAVRFSIQDNMADAMLRDVRIGAAWDMSPPEPPTNKRVVGRHQRLTGSISSFIVYVYGPGEDDSTFGDPLIEPFDFSPDSVDENGRIVIDLMDRPDYESLLGLQGDFWIHIRATEETMLNFLARSPLPDSSVHRNWMFYAEGQLRRGPGVRGHRCGEGELIRYKKGWEEIIGLTFSPAWSEGQRGDVNDDGSVNVLDVLGVINHILGIIELTDLGELWRADCNGDEGINVLDALGIVNVILGISECEP